MPQLDGARGIAVLVVVYAHFLVLPKSNEFQFVAES